MYKQTSKPTFNNSRPESFFSLKDFHYELSPDRIAQQGYKNRDESKLMILNRSQSSIIHKQFNEIIECITTDDFLVFNNSKVFKARIFAKKETGGNIEILMFHHMENKKFQCLYHCSKKPKANSYLILPETQKAFAQILAVHEGELVIQFLDHDPFEFAEKHGHIPLPHYIKRDDSIDDTVHYQTVYAKNIGSVAAPTAGFHFSQHLLKRLKEKKIPLFFVTLHVGPGTFIPIRTDNIYDHTMHTEYVSIDHDTAESINHLKQKGKNLISVGTTTVRALESSALKNSGKLCAENYSTDIFIYPGFQFQMTDKLITNFHLPCSTLLLLVSAFAGRQTILNAYETAKKNNYMFYSYGDAMFII